MELGLYGGADEGLHGRLLVEGDLLEFALHRFRYTNREEDDLFLDAALLGGWHRDGLPALRTAPRQTARADRGLLDSAH